MEKCEVIAIANQKGGVGKTTTTFSLGVALSKQGKKVLLIDADPQADLTTYMGWNDQDSLNTTIATLMNDVINDKNVNVDESILHHKEGVDLIPSSLDLSTMEFTLVNAMSREFTIRNIIQDIKKDYDYILIDCMPSLGMLTINALASSDKVVIPVQSQYLAAKGTGQLLKTISKVKRSINPDLKVGGILLTLVDNRTKLSKDIKKEIQLNYGAVIDIYDTQIPIAIKTAESTSRGISILEYDKNSKVSKAYSEFAKEVIENGRERIKNEASKVYSR